MSRSPSIAIACHITTPYLQEGYGAFRFALDDPGRSAVFEGARALIEKIRQAAAARLGVSAAEIELVDWPSQHQRRPLGVVPGIGGRGLARRHHIHEQQQAELFRTGRRGACGGRPGTGRVELLDYLVVEDVGRIVNPLTLHGQAIGGVVQGLGGAFMENLVYDANGQLLTGTLADYLIPTASDFARIRAIALKTIPPQQPTRGQGCRRGRNYSGRGLIANAVASALARSEHAEPYACRKTAPARVAGGGMVFKGNRANSREVGRRRDQVVGQCAGQQLAVCVVDKVLHKRAAKACTTPPIAWPCRVSGLTMRPTSSTTR